MKVYRLTTHDKEDGHVVSWYPSKEAADIMLRYFSSDLGADAFALVECVEIPTNKNELVVWLNRNFNRDNG